MTGLGPSDQFRAAMRRFPSGVTVITCRVDGVDHAMTASAFAAVSLDPPLVLVCVNRSARFAEAIASTDRWGVSILQEGAEPAARWFATSGRELVGQLDRVPHARGASGVALLDASLAHLECTTRDVVPAGDHDVVIGAVGSVVLLDHPRDGLPLVYWAGDYRRLDREAGP